MKSYQTFTAEDFACDSDFLKWVKYPERYPELDTFWGNWLRQHPEKAETVEEARYLILAVAKEDQQFPADARKAEVWKRIVLTTNLPEVAPSRKAWYAYAAVVAAALLAGAVWVANRSAPVVTEIAAEDSHSDYVKYVNNAGEAKTIILGDGTTIVLQPNSTLEYPKIFNADVREVRMEGQAFFEVTRNPDKPFIVRSGEIVTRVLGTSFTVRNMEGEGNVLVQVATGKVSVFRSTEEDRPLPAAAKAVDGVVLMPNQQVVYERLEMRMTKSLVENPRVLIPVEKQTFDFVDTPITEVFAAIEEAYGVDIVFDEEALSSCYLNASLTDVPLYEKLKLICKGINTTYEIIDSHIVVYGKGCYEDSDISN